MQQQDWQVNKTQHECAKYMLDNQLNADVNFRVGENQEMISANKLFLSIRSPVFDRMFNGSFKEVEEDPVIPDISPDTFKIVLRYCYYECLVIPDDLLVSTLYAAKKYMLPLLEQHAKTNLTQNPNGSNIWDIYKYHIDTGDDEVYTTFMEYFKGNVVAAKEALHSETFRNVTHEQLINFLHGNDQVDKHYVSICISEIELFKACNVWAEAECLRQEIAPTGSNKRAVLGQCLFLIRFPTMLYEDLVNEVYPAGLLIQVEKDTLCRYKHKKAGSKYYVEFPTAERQYQNIAEKDAEPEHQHTISITKYSTIMVKPQERVLLSKLVVRSSWQPKGIIVRDETSGEAVSMKPSDHYEMLEGRTGVQYIRLDIEPMVLKAGSKYSVTVEADANVNLLKPGSDLPTTGRVTPIKQVRIYRGSTKEKFLRAITFSLV